MSASGFTTSDCWGTNGKYDKASIGIEFANELELLPSGGKFYAFDRVASNNDRGPEPLKRSWRAHELLGETGRSPSRMPRLSLLGPMCTPWHTEDLLLPIHDLRLPPLLRSRRILCHANCRQDKTDMILEDWVWANCSGRVQLVGNGAPGIAAP